VTDGVLGHLDDEPDASAAVDALRLDFAPWEWERAATPAQRSAMQDRVAGLRARGHVIGAGCTVSPLAAVDADTLVLGDRSYVAAHAHVTGDVELGADCSVNVGAVLRGRVRVGDGVRIGAYTSVLGFDHVFDDPEVAVFQQPLTSEGVHVGDDVWLGTHVVVVDGVRIGSHAVVGAGAVVTRDVPEWAVAVGNPARVVGDRRQRRAVGRARGRRARLEARARDVHEQLPGILARAWVDGAYRDAEGAEPTVRAHCDAVELADLLGTPPPQLTPDEHVRRLRGLQDPTTGLVAELDGGPAAPDPAAFPFPDHGRAYHVLCVGYALDLLGSSFPHPVTAVTALEPPAVVEALERLPWETNAWAAGAVVDAIGTALTWAQASGHRLPEETRESLVRWLADARDRGTGLWGSCADGLREPVNGTYRLLRGTFAQWGLRAGPDEALVDTLLRRAAEVLDAPSTTACDVLDVVHPLWWAGAVGDGRRARDVDALARELVELTLGVWVPGQGAPFATDGAPSLQGTEMWSAITWYLADLLGHAEALTYRPRGVHRPEPRPLGPTHRLTEVG